ncbi:MAG: fructose-bisphosphatase [Candidatus Magasanikbacteria bacterium RIFCSPHIGHO2_02_FULL_51_14]|uniref:Fructose-1,6-bisphosphatase class 1 n=1 Tax=Candidatus Magasanikbacteria bacterium RIFCSPHIGHO2_02_FULL_51_14 TaxID=1798683 RepID=A0A1F6MQN3_9BACT|nr:MAG: fructose-bisphosphatase [Candidatus Magasanikbacteria bacterium RIFCSPHIGHO2_02_FULL_51_14]
MHTPPTLSQFLFQDLKDHPERLELDEMMTELATIGKQISHETNKAGLANILGAAGSVNVQGEEVQKLDVFANELCKKTFRECTHFAAFASEEEDTVVDIRRDGDKGNYVIAFDPLDGSSNIDVNVSVGTIFSVHRVLPDFPPTDVRQFFQKGRDQVLAGYILYGSSTVLVFSFGEAVREFTLDPDSGEFYLSKERVTAPDECTYYSVNEMYTAQTSTSDQEFLRWVKEEKKCAARHIGSLVADFHRNLLKGGVHMSFPRDKDGTGVHKVKLRLNYELQPLAFVLEASGGRATNGKENILDIVPTELHQREAVVMGNRDVVEQYIKKFSRAV